eukprot:SM000093S24448  [mRNA]  locus=s93:418081:420021:+ [translate_table: standard]
MQLFRGRSPLEIYTDFMLSFRDTFLPYLGSTIVEVSVGLGPAGELRYPSYPEGDGRWRFPGIGEFQCYDKYMMANLRACAVAVGMPDWGTFGPHDAGCYNDWPNDTGFFNCHYGSWNTAYGDFFLSWYSHALISHGDRVLGTATAVFAGTGTIIAAKLPGIHWWYKPPEALCSPESLLFQVRRAAASHDVPVAGENALPRYDTSAYERVKFNVHRPDLANFPRLASFTFLRMGEQLFRADHWRHFVKFVCALDQNSSYEDRDKAATVVSFPHTLQHTYPVEVQC